jgi:hypothetical protein
VPEITVDVPSYTTFEVEIDVSDYISTLDVDIEIEDHLDEIDDETLLANIEDREIVTASITDEEFMALAKSRSDLVKLAIAEESEMTFSDLEHQLDSVASAEQVVQYAYGRLNNMPTPDAGKLLYRFVRHLVRNNVFRLAIFDAMAAWSSRSDEALEPIVPVPVNTVVAEAAN